MKIQWSQFQKNNFALKNHFSLTPRFNAVNGEGHERNRLNGFFSCGAFIAPLKQGVNEMFFAANNFMNSLKTATPAKAVVIPAFCAMFNGRRDRRVAKGKI
jgi:hypothetical protein